MYILEHARDRDHLHDEDMDAGYVPCMICDTLELAQQTAVQITEAKHGEGLDGWSAGVWPEGVSSWFDNYRLPSGIWCCWRIVELPVNKFVLGYELEWA